MPFCIVNAKEKVKYLIDVEKHDLQKKIMKIKLNLEKPYSILELTVPLIEFR